MDCLSGHKKVAVVIGGYYGEVLVKPLPNELTSKLWVYLRLCAFRALAMTCDDLHSL